MSSPKAKAIVLLVSATASLAVGYLAYDYLTRQGETVVHRGSGNDYAVSLFNTRGQVVGEQDGNLKLALDPFVIYRNYPNQQTDSYSIDGRGFREAPLENGSRDLAMLLGGSAAFGQGLSDNLHTFGSIITRSNDKYDVVNCGVIGFLSGQELSQMVHYLDDYRPSLYIVFDGWNDINASFDDDLSWPKRLGALGFNRNFFLIESRLASYRQEQLAEAAETPQRMPPIGEALSEDEYYDRVRDKYLSNLDKMSTFATARGAKFLVVFQPELSLKVTKSQEEEKILQNWNRVRSYVDHGIPRRYAQLISDARDFCERREITYIDINRESVFVDNPETLFFDVVHPNEPGHQIVAEIINEVLLAQY